LIDELQHLVEHLENDSSLMEPNELRRRLDALDRLDAHFPNSPEQIPGTAAIATELHRRARAMCARLEAVNCELYEAVRCEIRRGIRPDTLLRWVNASRFNASPDIEELAGPPSGIHYDYRDELISGVLEFEEPKGGFIHRDSDMVFYQPTPARHIFHMIAVTALTASDVLVDLGSGLGHVPLLVSMCTGASSVGIEVEASYVESARQCARRLNLNRVAFIQQDARAADLSKGTVFYLYTPFTGSTLRCVLNLLRREAATRRIRICTYGPCTSVIAEEPWLGATAPPAIDRIAVFSSCD
jgi:hypothetical protein